MTPVTPDSRPDLSAGTAPHAGAPEPAVAPVVAAPTDEADEPISLKAFLLAATLWLPLAFFLWYALSAFVMYPVNKMTAFVLLNWMPDLVGSVTQRGGLASMVLLVVETVPGFAYEAGKTGMLWETYNTMQFCYGLPVFVGLLMATPMTWGQTFRQLAIGYACLLPAQIFSLLGAVLLDLQYKFGPQAAEIVASHGLSPYVTALWYQFGYLVLPAVAPVIIWALLNRRFIEALRDEAQPLAEPEAPVDGPTAVTDDKTSS
jgi:hypothetical protein